MRLSYKCRSAAFYARDARSRNPGRKYSVECFSVRWIVASAKKETPPCCRFVPRKRFPWIPWSWRKRKECLRRGATRRECSPGVLVVASSSFFLLLSFPLSLLHFEVYVHLGRLPRPSLLVPLPSFFHRCPLLLSLLLLYHTRLYTFLFLSFTFFLLLFRSRLAGETNRTFRSSLLFSPLRMYLVPFPLLLVRISFLPPGRTAAGSSLFLGEKG